MDRDRFPRMDANFGRDNKIYRIQNIHTPKSPLKRGLEHTPVSPLKRGLVRSLTVAVQF